MNSLASQNKESWLSWFLRGLLILLFIILFAKLIEVQVIKGGYYRTLSQENRIRHVSIPAPRGRILARGGEELATNVEIKKRIEFGSNGNFQISDDLTNVTPDEIVVDYKRVYPLGDELSHAVGYLAQVNADEVGKINPGCPEKGPRASDMLIGKTGLEQTYECRLLGTPGEELIEVNTSGGEVRVLGRREPVPGQDLITTIDYGLQIEVAKDMNAMNGKKGAAIVTTPMGQILAYYSFPSFDPNLFVDRNNSQEVGNLLKDPDLPLFDRIVSGTFHPGSVFKPLVAIAALEAGVIDKNFIFDDKGVININSYSYTNWYFTEYGRTEGPIGLVKAIARSTDTFFYTIGQMAGPEAIAKWAKVFGLDTRTGIDIPGEKAGLIPTPEWKEQTQNQPWFLGNTYHMAIGQGDVSVTPIEINAYISAIADNGKLCTPHFSGPVSQSFQCKQMNVKQGNLDLVKQGMEAACSPGGTAFTFFDFGTKHNGLSIACKTGTAEVGTDGTPHAWFTFFAPVDNPKIIATVLVERGGEGSSVAGPIARKIADYYFMSQSN
ncbi:MAG TPA: penicillin-binding transpeptidase domain-containing protein [Candidatus Saccharimonadales bacterium]|jgi:penicillin-binding protein 2|nr:penicillin-binding transpeptidase domain-containing protein [Candidatus Saccharimonadales bacterium]